MRVLGPPEAMLSPLELVQFINGPWDGVLVWARKANPRRVWPRVLKLGVLRGEPLPWMVAVTLRLPVDLEAAPAGDYVYRREVSGPCLYYYYAAQPRTIWSSS